jgi:hypothetical protein
MAAHLLCLQGFANTSATLDSSSTVWGVHHLPDNRDVAMITSGDGNASLWRYSYPDQRKVKVSSRSSRGGRGGRAAGCSTAFTSSRRPCRGQLGAAGSVASVGELLLVCCPTE